MNRKVVEKVEKVETVQMQNYYCVIKIYMIIQFLLSIKEVKENCFERGCKICGGENLTSKATMKNTYS